MPHAIACRALLQIGDPSATAHTVRTIRIVATAAPAQA
ncbi:MAG: hypothetical protein JWR65_221 [Massilia sp.]|nr:hypothetical protein [Massilia sp.]